MSEQLCLELPFTLAAPRSLAPRRNAADEIRRILMDVLPAGVPPSFGRVVTAKFDGKSRVVAELEMVDGLRATVEAWQWSPKSWAHRWVEMDGGDLSWEDGAWQRIDRAQSTNGEVKS